MATDLATLAIRVENGDVIKTTTSLNSMEVAGSKAEASTQRLTRRMALLQIQASEMDAALAKSQSTTGKLVSAMGLTEEAATRLGKAFSALSVVGVAGFLGHKLFEETVAAQNAMAQLEAAVSATGGAAGRTVDQLDAFSHALQDTSVFSDEAVKSAQAVLLTFNKIKGDNLDRATVAVTNLATRLGKDLPEAALQVGKALQDPVEGLNALTRLGIRLSQSQKDAIQDLVDTGHAAQAQGIILKELEGRYVGAAEAARNTLGGALKGLANDFGDLFEVSKGGTSGVVDAIHGLDSAVRTLGQNMGAVITAGELLAAVFAGRMVAGLAKAAAAQANVASAALGAGTIQREAAASAIATATAQQQSAARVIAALHAEAVEVERLIVLERERAAAARASAASVAFQLTPTNTGATGPAADFYGRKQQETQLAAATATRTAALEAEAAAIASEEALEARRAQILVQATAVEVSATEATVARTAAVAAEGEVIAATSVLSQAGAAASGFFGKAITALGGPIGATIILATALNAALDAYDDHLLKAAEQTDAEREATERALATAHARAAAQRKEADDLSEAARKFAALSAQRTNELGKLTALNGAYRQSEVALAILGLRYDAQIQKSEDAKEHHGRELAALNALTDSITRQKIAQVLLNDELAREARLRDARTENRVAVRTAQHDVTLAVLPSGARDDRQIELNRIDAIADADIEYHEKIKRMTAAQAADEARIHSERVARINLVASLQEAALDAQRRAATELGVKTSVRDADAETAGIRAMTAAELEGGQAVEQMRVQLAGNDAVQRALNDAIARGTELTEAQAGALRRSAEELERTRINAEKLRAVFQEVSGAVNQFFTDVFDRKNPFPALAARIKAELIGALSDAVAKPLTIKIAKVLGIEVPEDKQVKAAKDMNIAADKQLRAAELMTGSVPGDGSDVATQRYASQFTDTTPPWQQGAAQTPPIVPHQPPSSTSDSQSVMKLLEAKLPNWLGNVIETVRKYAAPAVIGYAAGTAVGESAYSTSHGTFGNYARGAIGGAVSGAVAGAAVGGVPGAIVGAVAGFVGGIVGVDHASKEAAKATAELRKQLELNMESLRATVSHDDLGQAIAQANAQRETLRKQIEDAYSGGGANSDTVKERNRQLAEMNALEDKYIAQLKEEAAAKSRYLTEDLDVEQERARASIAESQGNTAEAKRLNQDADRRAYNESQQRRLEDYARTHDIVNNKDDAAQYAQLQQTVALNEQAYALKQNTEAINALTTTVRGGPTGFKLDGYIQQFATGSPYPAPQQPTPWPTLPNPMSPLAPPMFSSGGSSTGKVATAPVNVERVEVTLNVSGVQDPVAIGKLGAKAFLAELDKSVAASGGLNTTRAVALNKMTVS